MNVVCLHAAPLIQLYTLSRGNGRPHNANPGVKLSGIPELVGAWISHMSLELLHSICRRPHVQLQQLPHGLTSMSRS